MYRITRYDGRGRVLQVLETQVLGLAKLFALQNTKGKGTTDIINSYTGEVLYIVQGRGANMFPKVVLNQPVDFKVHETTPTL